ncbi:MAG: CapA family protein [Malacoplasma sp.]
MKKLMTILMLFILITGCKKEVKQPVIEPPKEKIYKISLALAGDVLVHSAVYQDAKTSDGYDFKNMVSLVKPLLKNYDLAFYNQETILGGMELGLSTYPRFNSPIEVGDAMIDMGFNLVSLANNHTLDRGEEAIISSTNYWKSKSNVLTAGSYQSEEDRIKDDIREKNGITYALLAYTTATNGLKPPYEKDYLINIYNEEKAKDDIKRLRDKVDVLMVSMHWGSEYTHVPTAEEIEIAKFLASQNVDIVIGHHPHVIQPITYIDNTLVIYSLGNFLSGQVGEAKNIGMLASVDITKKVLGDSKVIKIDNVGTELIYTHYDGYTKNGLWYCKNYKLYPFNSIDNNILNDYVSIMNKYNNIITDLDKAVKVNIFSDNIQKVGD